MSSCVSVAGDIVKIVGLIKTLQVDVPRWGGKGGQKESCTHIYIILNTRNTHIMYVYVVRHLYYIKYLHAIHILYVYKHKNIISYTSTNIILGKGGQKESGLHQLYMVLNSIDTVKGSDGRSRASSSTSAKYV